MQYAEVVRPTAVQPRTLPLFAGRCAIVEAAIGEDVGRKSTAASGGLYGSSGSVIFVKGVVLGGRYWYFLGKKYKQLSTLCQARFCLFLK